MITYNQEKYVAQAVESILMQQVNNDIQLRVIIADDCSKDKTLEIIKSYEAKSRYPFIYLDSEQNIGVAANYKRAFNATQAEFVAILEGDDYWNDKCRLQKHVNYLSSHTQCAMTKNNYLVYSQSDNEWTVELAKESIYTLRKALVNYELANMSCCVFRGNIVRNMDERVYDYGHKQWKEATDWYTHLYVLQRGYCYIFDDVMSVYRVDTGDNISRTIRTDVDFVRKAHLCYELSLEMLGNSFYQECNRKYTEAKKIVTQNKRNIRYQKYSFYIPPIIAHFVCYTLPIIFWNIKHSARLCIPDGLYKFVRRK